MQARQPPLNFNSSLIQERNRETALKGTGPEAAEEAPQIKTTLSDASGWVPKRAGTHRG